MVLATLVSSSARGLTTNLVCMMLWISKNYWKPAMSSRLSSSDEIPVPLHVHNLSWGSLLSPNTVYSHKNKQRLRVGSWVLLFIAAINPCPVSSSAIYLYELMFHAASRSCHCILSLLQTVSKVEINRRLAGSLHTRNPLSHLMTWFEPRLNQGEVVHMTLKKLVWLVCITGSCRIH